MSGAIQPMAGNPPPGFTRTLVQLESRTLIHSSCDYCALSVSGADAKLLCAIEVKHRDRCRKPKPAPFTGR